MKVPTIAKLYDQYSLGKLKLLSTRIAKTMKIKRRGIRINMRARQLKDGYTFGSCRLRCIDDPEKWGAHG